MQTAPARPCSLPLLLRLRHPGGEGQARVLTPARCRPRDLRGSYGSCFSVLPGTDNYKKTGAVAEQALTVGQAVATCLKALSFPPPPFPPVKLSPSPPRWRLFSRPLTRPCALRRRAESAAPTPAAPRRSPARSEPSAAAARQTLPGNRPLPRCDQSEPEQT